jgi:TonB family protein
MKSLEHSIRPLICGIISSSLFLHFFAAQSIRAQASELETLAMSFFSKLETHKGRKLIVADFVGPKVETTQLGRVLADELSAVLAKQTTAVEVLPRNNVVIFNDPVWGLPEEALVGQDALTMALAVSAEWVVTGNLQVKKDQLELEVCLWEIPLRTDRKMVYVSNYPAARKKAKLLLTEPRKEMLEKLLPSVEKGKRRISAGFLWPVIDSGQPKKTEGDPHASPENTAATPPVLHKPGKDGVSLINCLSCPPPLVPPQSMNSRIQGVVILKVIITPQGNTENVRVVRSLHKDFDKSAVAAVKNWKFNPARGPDGKPVYVEILIEVTFRIPK